ncbi:MAG: hypothetical protein Q4G30_05040 [Actinomycetaceae bacterium]|nr:hypothetical protein [Actinomycetaceae bacterium]
MEKQRSAVRFAAVVAKQRQADALRAAQTVVDRHGQWVLSHLSFEDRQLIYSVTGEMITDQTRDASLFALTLAESRIEQARSAQQAHAGINLIPRPPAMTQHDRVATFTSMRAMMGNESVGRSLDMEA